MFSSQWILYFTATVITVQNVPYHFETALFVSDMTYNTGMRVKRQDWKMYQEKWRAMEVTLKDLLLSVSGAGSV